MIELNYRPDDSRKEYDRTEYVQRPWHILPARPRSQLDGKEHTENSQRTERKQQIWPWREEGAMTFCCFFDYRQKIVVIASITVVFRTVIRAIGATVGVGVVADEALRRYMRWGGIEKSRLRIEQNDNDATDAQYDAQLKVCKQNCGPMIFVVFYFFYRRNDTIHLFTMFLGCLKANCFLRQKTKIIVQMYTLSTDAAMSFIDSPCCLMPMFTLAIA